MAISSPSAASKTRKGLGWTIFGLSVCLDFCHLTARFNIRQNAHWRCVCRLINVSQVLVIKLGAVILLTTSAPMVWPDVYTEHQYSPGMDRRFEHSSRRIAPAFGNKIQTTERWGVIYRVVTHCCADNIAAFISESCQVLEIQSSNLYVIHLRYIVLSAKRQNNVHCVVLVLSMPSHGIVITLGGGSEKALFFCNNSSKPQPIRGKVSRHHDMRRSRGDNVQICF